MSTFEIIVSLIGGAIAAICTGAIPWAYMVGSRLTRIEVIVANGMKADIAYIKDLLEQRAVRIANVETDVALLKSAVSKD